MTTTEQLNALSSILAQGSLHSLFQPIICLSERRILGYEAGLKPGVPHFTTE